MVNPQMVMYEEEFNQIQGVVDRLVREANAKVVFIVDKNGQLIAASGDVENIDTTSLASLTAGNIAATGGIAKLLRENEFATQFHEGENQNIHIQLVGNRVILVVIFDSKSSLGLVRLRVRKATQLLNWILDALLSKVVDPGGDSPFAEITGDDIDNLFTDGPSECGRTGAVSVGVAGSAQGRARSRARARRDVGCGGRDSGEA